MSDPVENSAKVADTIFGIVDTNNGSTNDASNPEQTNENSAAIELPLSINDESTDRQAFETDEIVLLQEKLINNEEGDAKAGNYSENGIGGQVHIGVECDCCKMKPIKGKRFKCSTCPFLSYCEDCKIEGKYPWPCKAEHDLECIYIYTQGKN